VPYHSKMSASQAMVSAN